MSKNVGGRAKLPFSTAHEMITGKDRLKTVALASLAAILLAACEPGSGPLASPPSGEAEGEAPAAKTQRSTRLVDRDVEAPQVFQVSDTALWDGRPSLGGVWVASPDAKDPERVIMRNPANGKFVIGALFRRELQNPGPKLQISSDAAEALGMLAGAPGKISVTALRREEVPETTPETPILDTAEALATPAVSTAIDGGGVTTAALDAPAAAAASPTATPPKAAASATKPAAKPADKPAAKAAAPAQGRAIQIGFFSVEANAKRAVETLAKSGVTAKIRQDTTNGKSYWSVTARGTADTLKKIKSAGFSDAYLLK